MSDIKISNEAREAAAKIVEFDTSDAATMAELQQVSEYIQLAINTATAALNRRVAEQASIISSLQSIIDLGGNIGYGSAVTSQIERLQQQRDRLNKRVEELEKENKKHIEKARLEIGKRIVAESKLSAMIEKLKEYHFIKLLPTEWDETVLQNLRGDTFTSYSEEIADFFHPLTGEKADIQKIIEE